MKTTLNIKELQTTIKEVNKLKYDKELPVTNNIQLLSEDGQTYIIKNTVECIIKKKINSYVHDHGEFNIDESTAKLLLKLKNDDITFEDKQIATRKKVIKVADTEFLNTIKIDNPIKSIEVDSQELLRMLEVNYTCASDETRPIIQGVCFNNNEVCALDGYRLSLRSTEKFDLESEFVINNKYIKILKTFLSKEKNDTLKIELYEKFAKFILSDVELTCILMEGKFINYKSLLPSELTGNILNVKDKDELKDSLELMLEVDKKTSLVKLQADSEKNLTIEASSIKNSLKDTLENSIYKNSNDRSLIAFNVKYLLDAIKNTNYNNMNWCYVNNVTPMIICDSLNMDNLELVLPVRLTK